MNTIDNPILVGLPDLCVEILSFAASLRRAEDPGELEPLRARIDELFRAMETRAHSVNVAQEDAQGAKYALCALIDEIVLSSSWPIKEAWLGRPLQLEFFNDFSAGEGFYTRVEELRKSSDPRKAAVLEVYYLCLALGFKGMYADLQGMEKLRVLLDSLGRELRAVRHPQVQGLAPPWERREVLQQRERFSRLWVVVACCAAAVLLIYIVLAVFLGSSVEKARVALEPAGVSASGEGS